MEQPTRDNFVQQIGHAWILNDYLMGNMENPYMPYVVDLVKQMESMNGIDEGEAMQFEVARACGFDVKDPTDQAVVYAAMEIVRIRRLLKWFD